MFAELVEHMQMLLPVMCAATAKICAVESCTTGESRVGGLISLYVCEITCAVAMRLIDCDNFILPVTVVFKSGARSVVADCS